MAENMSNNKGQKKVYVPPSEKKRLDLKLVMLFAGLLIVGVVICLVFFNNTGSSASASAQDSDSAEAQQDAAAADNTKMENAPAFQDQEKDTGTKDEKSYTLNTGRAGIFTANSIYPVIYADDKFTMADERFNTWYLRAKHEDQSVDYTLSIKIKSIDDLRDITIKTPNNKDVYLKNFRFDNSQYFYYLDGDFSGFAAYSLQTSTEKTPNRGMSNHLMLVSQTGFHSPFIFEFYGGYEKKYDFGYGK